MGTEIVKLGPFLLLQKVTVKIGFECLYKTLKNFLSSIFLAPNGNAWSKLENLTAYLQ